MRETISQTGRACKECAGNVFSGRLLTCWAGRSWSCRWLIRPAHSACTATTQKISTKARRVPWWFPWPVSMEDGAGRPFLYRVGTESTSKGRDLTPVFRRDADSGDEGRPAPGALATVAARVPEAAPWRRLRDALTFPPRGLRLRSLSACLPPLRPVLHLCPVL